MFLAYSEKFQYLWIDVFIFFRVITVAFLSEIFIGIPSNFLKGSENLAYCFRIGDH